MPINLYTETMKAVFEGIIQIDEYSISHTKQRGMLGQGRVGTAMCEVARNTGSWAIQVLLLVLPTWMIRIASLVFVIALHGFQTG